MADLIGAIPSFDLPAGFVVKFEAIDPTTGAAVAGVKVSSAIIYGTRLGDAGVSSDGGVTGLEGIVAPLGWLPVELQAQTPPTG